MRYRNHSALLFSTWFVLACSAQPAEDPLVGNCEKASTGMSPTEVLQLIGRPPARREVSSTLGLEVTSLSWASWSGESCTAFFVAGRLVRKEAKAKTFF